VQSFLPYSSYEESAKVLDYRRLGKQRVEAYQLIRVLSGQSKGWLYHPATKMWAGYMNALCLYYNTICHEWESQGYVNNLPRQTVFDHLPTTPIWLGSEAFHLSHRSNLVRKLPSYYGNIWTDVHSDLPYVWPLGNMETYRELVEYYQRKVSTDG